eukprot:CAMPEP_0182454234 /NCGR_PEP_ID=MMETSP1319-20130603/960_1 /TAXON_ID=172717 /ORGANISM="Bolidomonas pacifica, Strain RCC208" /LENGTH=230 /DNA_ID=CAMNT_0024652233 /DNA_START=111 /DNA_END=800 /DNA_ORIENTATION=-
MKIACFTIALIVAVFDFASPLSLTPSTRRAFVVSGAGVSTAATAAAFLAPVLPASAAERGNERLQSYPDFTPLPSGISFKDATPAGTTLKGSPAQQGDRVVYAWSGYTIGYFGRPFQASGGPQGGAFDKEQDYNRCVLGDGSVVKGLEEGMRGMSAGQVRQVIVPAGPLSYPEDGDPKHDRVGPKPTTFSGERALNFVLENKAGTIDKTLLFNVKVIRVDKRDGKGGFVV